MKRGPVGEQKTLVRFATVSFQVAAAVCAIVDSQTALAFDGNDRQPMIVPFLAERTAGSPVAPACSAESAHQPPQAAWIVADQLRHRGRLPTLEHRQARPPWRQPLTKHVLREPTMTIRDPFLADLWRFVRGDGESAEFEQWIYAHSEELESRLGEQPALEVLTSDFRSSADVACVKQLLREYAERESELECRCITLPTVAAIDMGEESNTVFETIEQRRSRGEPFWWLWSGECTRCGQWWLVGQGAAE